MQLRKECNPQTKRSGKTSRFTGIRMFHGGSSVDVDHVYHPVFCFGSENWSWTVETNEKGQKMGDQDHDAALS